MHHSAPALNGLKVLDFTQFLSGPYCTQILGDLGAEIIKVEAPQGDLARHIPPHFVDNDSVYYLSINRNKRSLVVDIKSAEGVALVRKLVLTCDVVVENFRPGVLDRLGLSVENFCEEKPALIWCSISGFGQTGPYRDKPAYDMIVQALSGGMSLTGEPDGASVRAGIPIGDIAAGMYAVIGVLAAIHRRQQTGQGEVIDISMLDCQAAMLSYQAAYHLHSGVVPGRQGRGHDSIATYRAFTAGDGIDIVVTANTEKMWAGLCRALGCEALIDDARFKTNRERHTNRHLLWPRLEAAFLKKNADEWVIALEAEHIPVGVVNTLDRVMADPQINARGMVLTLANDNGNAVRVMGNPIRMQHTNARDHAYPPAPGQNNAEILHDLLGFSQTEVDRLLTNGVICAPASSGTQKTM